MIACALQPLPLGGTSQPSSTSKAVSLRGATTRSTSQAMHATSGASSLSPLLCHRLEFVFAHSPVAFGTRLQSLVRAASPSRA